MGFILPDLSVVECKNISADPKDNFMIPAQDLLQYGEIAVASWHTHTEGSANLSLLDQEAYLNYPQMYHFIIGKGEIWCYGVKNNAVIQIERWEEDNHSAWEIKEPVPGAA